MHFEYGIKQSNLSVISEMLLQAEPIMLPHSFSHSCRDVKDYLRYSYLSGRGFFSYKNLYVLKDNNVIVGIFTLYPAKEYFQKLLGTIVNTLLFYGIKGSLNCLLRSKELSSLYHTPSNNCLYLANVAIASEFQGKGIYKLLNQKMISECIDSGFRAIELDVVKENNARNVYLKYGFEIESESNYSGNLKFTGIVRMIRTI